MADCGNLENCAFFKHYQNDEEKKHSLMGLVKKYCKGDRQDECVRVKVYMELGDQDKVPENMMPSGLPLFGTTNENWTEQVKEIAKTELRARIFC